MTAGEVDWAEVERRGRRLNWLVTPAVPLFFAAVILLTGGYAFWKGTGAWVAVGVFMLYGLGMQLLSVAVPRLRTRTGQSFRIQHALRHHVDPGPELREKADRYARQMAGNAWVVWLFPWAPVSFLLTGQWDAPARAVPGAVVIVAAVVAITVWWRRQADAARRWLAEPPGPARTTPAPRRWETWMSGRRLLWLMLGVAAVTLVSTAVLVALK